jgi:Domain of unknown function (DUF4329)
VLGGSGLSFGPAQVPTSYNTFAEMMGAMRADARAAGRSSQPPISISPRTPRQREVDRYASQVLTGARRDTARTGNEFGGYIFSGPDGKLGHTKTEGKTDEVDLSLAPNPAGTQKVGDYHTHPTHQGNLPSQFSQEDLDTTDAAAARCNCSYTGYLATPEGKFGYQGRGGGYQSGEFSLR